MLLAIRDGRLDVLLVNRLTKRLENRYAFLGGFLLENESLDDAAIRELREEAGVDASPANAAGGNRCIRGRLVSGGRSTALAFDHSKIVEYAHQRLRNQLRPEKFTLTGLQALHEAILGEHLDKRNFRRKVMQKGIVKRIKEWRPTGRKPAQLLRFVR